MAPLASPERSRRAAQAPLTSDEWWRRYGSCYTGRSWLDYRPLLAEALRHAPGPPLLDVGCGFGFLVECARQFGIPAIGVEGAAPALEEARRRHPHADVRPWLAGTPLPVETNTIGLAVANEVLDHFTMPENESLLKELFRALRPAGILIIKSPSRTNAFDTDEGHVSGFTPSELRQFVERHGLAVRHQTYLPQPLWGERGPGWLAMRVLARLIRPERWNARVDLIAEKQDACCE